MEDFVKGYLLLEKLDLNVGINAFLYTNGTSHLDCKD